MSTSGVTPHAGTASGIAGKTDFADTVLARLRPSCYFSLVSLPLPFVPLTKFVSAEFAQAELPLRKVETGAWHIAQHTCVAAVMTIKSAFLPSL
jgi:hypothetical protein